jgi:mono/diheme cytochrome c family protein
MRRVLKWIGIGVGALIGIAALAVAGLYFSTQARFRRTYDIAVQPVRVSSDAETLARGEHFVNVLCKGCHTPDLGGGPILDDPALGVVDAANLTSGRGGVGALYGVDDWVRALRHGVRHDGRSVFIMPSGDFYHLSEEDLGAMIAYLQTVPPVDRTPRPRSFTPVAKVMYGLGAFGNLLYAETIPHDVRPTAAAEGATPEYGEYLVNVIGCRQCHGETLSGGQGPEPGMPPGPNLTSGGELYAWSEADFISVLRTGRTPSGRQLNPEFMPWESLAKMTDVELGALWAYLASLPAMEATTK